MIVVKNKWVEKSKGDKPAPQSWKMVVYYPVTQKTLIGVRK